MLLLSLCHVALAINLPNLTDNENNALKNYSTSSYTIVNPCLRSGECNPHNNEEYIKEQIKLIQSALLKMKRSEFVTTYRGTAGIPDEKMAIIESSTQSAVKVDDGFMSSSSSRSTAERIRNELGYVFDDPVLFIISSKSCVDISTISSFPSEEEYLCPAGLMFYVRQDSTNKNIYYLEEQ